MLTWNGSLRRLALAGLRRILDIARDALVDGGQDTAAGDGGTEEVSSSSSQQMASCRWRGVMRFMRRSLNASPVNHERVLMEEGKLVWSGRRGRG